MVLATNETRFEVINEGKDLFRQKGCNGCHRDDGYDKEPEDLNSISQQLKQLETDQKDNTKQAAELKTQADAAQRNEGANRLNDKAIALRVAKRKVGGRLQHYDLQQH